MKDQLFNGKILFSLLTVLICLGFTTISYGQAADEAPAEAVVTDAGAAAADADAGAADAGAAADDADAGAADAGADAAAADDAGAADAGADADAADDAAADAADAGADADAADDAAADAADDAAADAADAADDAGAAADADAADAADAGAAAGAADADAADDAAADAADAGADADAADDAAADAADDAAADAADAADDAGAADADAAGADAADDAGAAADADAADAADAGAAAGAADADAAADAGAADAGADADAADDAAADAADAGAADAGAAAAEEEDAEGDTAAAAEMPMSQMFEITLTNLTTGEHGVSGQILSPPIFVTHAAGIKLVQVGEAASAALVALAEGGDTSMLAEQVASHGGSVVTADGVVDPGQSVTVTVTADAANSSLSVGAMLVSTNDAFVAATDVPLFDEAGMPVTISLDLNAYDAGSEDNTERASDIPGPLGLDAAADPAGSNERVPTEGGVITPHEGIQGVGDVTEAFAWEEPTAMLTITPVAAAEPTLPHEPAMPEDPVVEGPVMPAVPGFDVRLEPGLNMISIPLMPEEPYTAKSLAVLLGSTIVIKLDAASQSFIGYSIAEDDAGFGIDGGSGYIVNTPAGGMVTFTGKAWANPPAVEKPVAEEPAADPVAVEPAAEEPAADPVAVEPAAEEPAEVVEAEPAVPAAAEPVTEEPAAEVVEAEPVVPAAAEPVTEEPAAEVAEDEVVEASAEAAVPAAPTLSNYKSAWAFVITSTLQDMDAGTTYTVVAENLRTGAITTERVSSDTKRASAVWADLNRNSVVESGDKLEITLRDEHGTIVSGPFQRTVSTSDIRTAYMSVQLRVGDVRPKETLLAQNFPNPFNPETWIPYQLNKATEVTLHIFDVSGRLVRTLDLGWQAPGSYMTPSSAAYWDGRNAVGERVSSGIYFYTLQTSDFAATRRMVILK